MNDSLSGGTRPGLVALGTAALAALAAVPRLVTWANVFTVRGVRFVADGDPYYHVRRAAMILDSGSIVWRDPWLNYPAGADIPWPPLFDLLLAGTAWVVGLGHPSAQTLPVVAAFLPVLLGVAGVALGAWLAAEIFGFEVGAATAVLLALSAPNVFYSLLGRPDQHVLEVLLLTAVVLTFVRGLRGDRLRPGPVLLLGVTLALSFWNWLGSALTLAVLGACCVVVGIATPPDRPWWGRPAKLLAAGAATAAVLLAVSIGLFGRPGALARLTIGGLSGFQVLLPAITAVAAASMLLVRARSPAVRAAGLVCIPAALVALAVLGLPAVRTPILSGLSAASQANAWYGSIGEFMPVVFSGLVPVTAELGAALATFGLAPVLALIGVVEGVRRLRDEPVRRPAILVALTVAVLFGVATLAMARFMSYGSVPLAIFAALGIEWIRRRVAAWRPRFAPIAAVAAGAIALAPTAIRLVAGAQDMAQGALETLLLRVRDAPEQGDRRAVLVPWTYGHHVLWLARRPVVASPFGTEGGAGAIADLAAFYTELDADAAERLLQRRGVQYVLLEKPMDDVALLAGHGVRSGTAGAQIARNVALDQLDQLVVMRLYESAGSGSEQPERRALDGFRLVDEEDHDQVPMRLFEFVPGAIVTVRGGTPGGHVVATVTLVAPFGMEGDWRTVSPVNARGEAVVRLPYATGSNGRITAREYVFTDGARGARVSVTEQQVVGGAALAVELARRK